MIEHYHSVRRKKGDEAVFEQRRKDRDRLWDQTGTRAERLEAAARFASPGGKGETAALMDGLVALTTLLEVLHEQEVERTANLDPKPAKKGKRRDAAPWAGPGDTPSGLRRDEDDD